MHAQKKQSDCFNHRVVTMVADKLKRQWLWEVHLLIAEDNHAEGKLPNHHWSCIFERGHTCMYQRACKNSYYLTGIVTTEHLHKNHHKSIMKCSCSVSLTDVLHVSGKVWFGLRLLMQFQNKMIKSNVSSKEGKHSVVNLFLQCGNHACGGLWSIILTWGYS